MRSHRALLFSPPPTSAYIHLPFCAQKCSYCAFPVVVSSAAASHASYVDVLTREIKAFFSSRSNPPPLQTLYLGGGTPSLLHPSLLRNILTTLRQHVNIHPDAEITAEMDPATFTHSTAEQFARLGINRASVGAQSFDDKLLSLCNRIHTSRDTHTAVQTLRDVGFSKISLDLISGLPRQTITSWRHSLKEALSLEPDHISAYDLTLEPGTPFHVRYNEGQHPLPSDSDAAAMMSEAAHLLSDAHFEHYEISNFARRTGTARSSNRSHHNMAYWQNKPFYAFGMGATSVVDGFRFARPRGLGDYRRYVEHIERAEQEPGTHNRETEEAALFPHVRKQSHRERLEDFLINAFRLLIEGVDLSLLEREFDSTDRYRLECAVRRHISFQEQGLLDVRVVDARIERVRLTEKGALVENHILSSLLQDAIWRFPKEKDAGTGGTGSSGM